MRSVTTQNYEEERRIPSKRFKSGSRPKNPPHRNNQPQDSLPEIAQGPERFRVIEMIGEGTYGNIWKCLDLCTGETIVLKRIEKKNKGSKGRIQEEQRIHNEMRACSASYGIPGTPKTFGYFETPEYVFLAMEMIKGRDLYQILEDTNFDPIPESNAKNVFMQITSTLSQLHSKGVAHKDIKLENIMIDFETNDSFLIDFGLSFLFNNERNSKNCTDFGGSIEYSPPELMAKLPFSTEKSDVYSLGATLFCAVAGSFPHENLTNNKEAMSLALGRSRRNIKYPQGISNELKDLLNKMLADCPQNRISMKEVIQHPWFTRTLKEI